MQATYFDTPDGALAAQRLALRRRIGGKDAGWHLKSKGDDGAHELLWPDSQEMPDRVREVLREKFGENEGHDQRVSDTAAPRVRALATLHTIRDTTVVRNSDGEAIIELADDTVDATNELTGRRQQWREWEAALLPAAGSDAATGAKLLDLVEPLLVAAGATRVRGTSKIQRAMRQEAEVR